MQHNHEVIRLVMESTFSILGRIGGDATLGITQRYAGF